MDINDSQSGISVGMPGEHTRSQGEAEPAKSSLQNCLRLNPVEASHPLQSDLIAKTGPLRQSPLKKEGFLMSCRRNSRVKNLATLVSFALASLALSAYSLQGLTAALNLKKTSGWASLTNEQIYHESQNLLSKSNAGGALQASNIQRKRLFQRRRELDRSYQFDPKNGNILSHNDAILKQGSGWDVAPVVIEKYRLIFFTVPKIGTTVFKQLFRRMMGAENWDQVDRTKWPHLPHNPASNGLKYLYDFSITTANEMMTSPNWTRAIFVRDPVERLLSAYLDKALHANGYYIKKKCCKNPYLNPNRAAWANEPYKLKSEHLSESMRGNMRPEDFIRSREQRIRSPPRRRLNGVAEGAKRLPGGTTVYDRKLKRSNLRAQSILDFRKRLRSCDLGEFTFEIFVNQFMPFCNDPHWRPQSQRLSDWVWPYMNFIGYFGTIEEDATRLLKKLHAWENYGAWGWGSENASIFSSNNAHHRTSASQLIPTYYTPELKHKVRRFYVRDYNHPFLNFIDERRLAIPTNATADYANVASLKSN